VYLLFLLSILITAQGIWYSNLELLKGLTPAGRTTQPLAPLTPLAPLLNNLIGLLTWFRIDCNCNFSFCRRAEGAGN